MNISSACLAFLLLISPILASELADTHQLKGVLLVPSHDTSANSDDVRGFQAEGLCVPGGIEKLNNELSCRFIDQPLTQNDIIELKRAVILYYRDQGFPIVTVEIPGQKVNDGVVQLVVVEGVMGCVQVKCNRYFSDASFQREIGLCPTGPIDTNILLNDIAWINRNPFRHADVFFTPGAGERQTDIELQVKDRFPLRVYAGVDNTGVEVTDETRIWAGFNSRGILDDHVISYQFTTAPEYKKFWAHTLHYLAPLPWRHLLIVFGGYSHVQPDITDFPSSGHSAQASLRYDIPFKPMFKPLYHELSLGLDFKYLHNDLEFFSEEQLAAAPIVTKAVNLTQLYAGYRLSQNWKTNRITFDLELNWSPGEWVANQENSHFAELHPGAVNHYIYGMAGIADTWQWPYKFELLTTIRSQVSSQNLVPSEQFGLGGYDTVRGYDEREVNYDDAICVNLELHCPSFRVFRSLCKHPDSLTFLGFFDYGTGRNVHETPGETQWQQLIGIGPGVRYSIADYLSARLDWGFRMHEIEFHTVGSKLHFGVMASF